MQKIKEIKVVLLGESGVGKSCLLNRYVNDDFRQNIDPTIGAAFMSKMVPYKEDIFNFKVKIH